MTQIARRKYPSRQHFAGLDVLRHGGECTDLLGWQPFWLLIGKDARNFTGNGMREGGDRFTRFMKDALALGLFARGCKLFQGLDVERVQRLYGPTRALQFPDEPRQPTAHQSLQPLIDRAGRNPAGSQLAEHTARGDDKGSFLCSRNGSYSP